MLDRYFFSKELGCTLIPKQIKRKKLRKEKNIENRTVETKQFDIKEIRRKYCKSGMFRASEYLRFFSKINFACF